DDQWLGLEKGVYSLASRENHVTFVLFGNATNQATIANVANVYARLYGSAKTSPVISAAEIYTTLGDDQVSLFYYEIKANQVEGIVNALNDKYEDAEMVIATMPFVIAFLDGNIVDYAVLTEANVPLQLVNFYQAVFDSEAVQKLV